MAMMTINRSFNDEDARLLNPFSVNVFNEINGFNAEWIQK